MTIHSDIDLLHPTGGAEKKKHKLKRLIKKQNKKEKSI
jgi:hypothetical protein